MTKGIKSIKLSKGWFASLSVAILGVIAINLVGASGTASLTLNPASGSKEINTTFDVAIYENSGNETINTVDAHLSYDQTKLQFVKVTPNYDQFDSCPTKSGGSGQIHLICGKAGDTVINSQFVGTITFKALGGSGSTVVSFMSDSHILRSPGAVDVWNGITTGGTYGLTTPVTPTCPSGQTGTPPNCTTPPATTCPTGQTGTPPNCTTPPAKSTTKPAPVTTLPAGDVATQKANPDAPVPAGNIADNTEGYLVAIKVTDSHGKPVVDAKVELDHQTAQTDKNGIANFLHVTSGSHTAKIHSVLGVATIDVNVDASKSPTSIQEFKTALKPKTSPFVYLAEALGGLLVLGAIGVGIFYKLKGHFPWKGGGGGGIASSGPDKFFMGSDSAHTQKPESILVTPAPQLEAVPTPVFAPVVPLSVPTPVPPQPVQSAPPAPDIQVQKDEPVVVHPST